MSILICGHKCWPCLVDYHYDPPQWHTWADDADRHTHLQADLADPVNQPCQCRCARETGTADTPTGPDIAALIPTRGQVSESSASPTSPSPE